jgi:hypothetical protein
MRWLTIRLTGIVLVALVLGGCGGASTATVPSEAIQGGIARRFASVVLRGDAAAARALLVNPDNAALVTLVRRAAAPWRIQHAAIQRPARRAGNRWTFQYAGRRTHKDGRFETEKGALVVFLAPAGVKYFVFTDVRRRFSTHHDSQLLPSNR